MPIERGGSARGAGWWLRAACFLLAGVAVAGLFGFGATPAAVGLFKPPLDKLAHVAYHAALAGLLNAGWRGERPLAAILLAGSVAAADEIFQSFLPGRHAELADLAAGMLGALIGAFAARWLIGAWRRRCAHA